MSQDYDIKQQIAKLYPALNPDEIEEVETTLRSYLAIIRRIFEHVACHDKRLLTEIRRRAKVRKSGKKALRSAPFTASRH